MSTETNDPQTGDKEPNPPTHVAKIRYGHGQRAYYQRIGVAWADAEKGSTYVRLSGTQIVSDGFTLYPIEE